MSRMHNVFIGLMSGTSMDAVDAAVVDFSGAQPHVIAALARPIEDSVRQELLSLCTAGPNEIVRVHQADYRVGVWFADATLEILKVAGLRARDVRAIGSHGQTVRHDPHAPHPYSLQIGNPFEIRERTGITVVTDFRRADMAVGGQGAPLVPGFHHAIFAHLTHTRVIVNIGGMANITVLVPGAPVVGYDTGPGNVLLDAWFELHRDARCDLGGAWAASGHVIPALLQRLQADPYFATPPPKSTGREYFNMAWLAPQIDAEWADVDVQTTLTELTATTIANAILDQAPATREVLVCGGGVHNEFLMQRLQAQLPRASVNSTALYNVDPDFVEAVTFAWLAARTLSGQPGNLTHVTGARHPVVLGAIYPA